MTGAPGDAGDVTGAPGDAGDVTGAPGDAGGTRGPAVVLVGPPGADVPAVAVELGRLLGVPVRDTDTEVERAAGLPVSDLFVERGEAAFRELERTAVIAALAQHRGVLALGGGAVLDPVIEDALHGLRVVFLDVGVAEAARRLGFARDRPAQVAGPRGQWARLMEHRRAVYRRVAIGAVPTDGLTPAEAALAVRDVLGVRAGPAGTERRDRDSDERNDGTGRNSGSR